MYGRHKRRVVWLMMLIGLAIGLAACASSTVRGNFCDIAEPISADPTRDTIETVRQVDRHNVVGVELCGW
ncbi:MAG: hypothetical protein EA420_03425 [Candidatus Competibacteraceae bacterium]|nr:MAG: hypothetical protein EA420_03425 [Candidatus Competibacteraceae bacterium]